MSNAFVNIVQPDHEYPLWFAEGKTSLIPKAGKFSSENQRPITCLNNMYNWFTSCMLKPMNQHLDKYALIEGEQRGAKVGCRPPHRSHGVRGQQEKQDEHDHGMD